MRSLPVEFHIDIQHIPKSRKKKCETFLFCSDHVYFYIVWRNYKILINIKSRNENFIQKSKCWSKIEILVKNQNFIQKIKVLVKNRNFIQKINVLVKNRNFSQKSKF